MKGKDNKKTENECRYNTVHVRDIHVHQCIMYMYITQKVCHNNHTCTGIVEDK